jgi:hypothetical protein
MASKKQGTSASARQPKDAVPGDETVRVQQYFINETEFSSIDFGLVTKLSWVGGRHLIKPSELAQVLIKSQSKMIVFFLGQLFISRHPMSL